MSIKLNEVQKAILQVYAEVGKTASPEFIARSAVKFVDPKLVVKMTRRFKPRRNDTNNDIVLTVGRPNYAERAFVKLCVKAGEPFPVKKLQIRRYRKERK